MNRWLMPVAAVCVHICIGSVYSWSTFNRPIAALFPGAPVWFSPPYTTFSTALALLGLSAAFMGPWVERRGPRAAATAAAIFFGSGLLIGGAGLAFRQSVLVSWNGDHVRHWLRSGLHRAGEHARQVVSRSPRHGDGMAIMGFGGGAFLAGYLNAYLIGRIGVAKRRDASQRRVLHRDARRRAVVPHAAAQLDAARMDAAGQAAQDDRD